jgi:hypothetical protein
MDTGDDDVLTAVEAKTITECNKQQSAFLRLPGELRNIVYDYTFSDVIIHIRKAKGSDRQYTVFASLGGPLIHNILALTEVSRQLQYETRPYSFRMFTFHVAHDASFSRFIARLPNYQRKSISSVKLDHTEAYMAGTSVKMVTDYTIFKFRRREYQPDLYAWGRKMAFSRLPGLNKIGIHQGVPEYKNVYLQGFGYVLRRRYGHRCQDHVEALLENLSVG